MTQKKYKSLQRRKRGAECLPPHHPPISNHLSRKWARNLTFCEGLPLVQLTHELLGVKGCTLQGPGVWLLRGAGLRWGIQRSQSWGGKWGCGSGLDWGDKEAGQVYGRAPRSLP